MKRLRPLVACWVLVAILFVQLATAAHACMAMPKPPEPCADMAAMAGGDEPPLVCLEHCKGDVQLFDHHAPVAVSAGPVVTPIVIVVADEALSAATPGRSPPDPATSPPVFAASSRLRI